MSAFDKVILVGGSTRIPLVRRRVEQFFGSPPLDRVNADEVVAIGAAIQAAALTEVARRKEHPGAPGPRGAKVVLHRARRRGHGGASRPRAREDAAPGDHLARDSRPALGSPSAARSDDHAPVAGPARRSAAAPAAATPTLPLPTSTPGPTGLLGKTQPLPPAAPSRTPRPPSRRPTRPTPSPVQSRSRTSCARRCRRASPRAAPAPLLQAPVLVDVTPRALVVETVGGWCDVVVQRNAKIPCERTRAFTTSSDMQTVVRVRVAQGEDAVFENNTYLGEVELVGLRAAPRGEVTIRARFEVDESGTLKVFATDVATGREAHALLQLVGIAESAKVEAMKERHATARIS